MECKFVSDNLHHWIDLIFGYKQTGEQAIKSHNLYHPYMYEGVDLDAMEDEVQKNGAISIILNFGQMPKQLFKKPHPKRKFQTNINFALFHSSVYDRISPTTLATFQNEIKFLDHIKGKEFPFALISNRIPLYPEATKFISWGHWDQHLRICSMDTGKVLSVVEMFHDDQTVCAVMTHNGQRLITGSSSPSSFPLFLFLFYFILLTYLLKYNK